MYQLREVVLETTKRCNLNCIHCGSDCGHRAMRSELSIEEWKKVMVQLSEMGAEKIVFSGGEPILKKGFEELLLFAKSLAFGLKIGFISNGLIPFKKQLQEAIAQSKPFAVGLSIDGLKETHNRIRRSEKSWQGLMKNISILQDLGVQICAITTLHKLNFGELSKLANFLNLTEIDSWQIQLAMPFGRMENRKNLLIDEKDFKKICRTIFSLRNAYPKLNIQAADCFGLAPGNSIRSHDWAGCSAGISSIGIDAFGNVMPCLSLQNGQRCGNIRNKPIAGIWEKSSGFDFNRKFATQEVKGKCKKCRFLSECRGGCNSQSYAYYSRFHSSPFCFARSFCQQTLKGGKNEQYN